MLARLLELFNIHFKKNTKIVMLCIEGLLASISLCRQIMELRPEGVFGYYAVTILGILFIACYLGAVGYNIHEVIKDRSFMDTYGDVFDALLK